MKIAILSDTHDNLSNTIYALEICREQGVKTLIHCGDLTSFEMIPYFEGFRLIYTLGNMDHASGTITKMIKKLSEDNFVGLVYQGQLNRIALAATHSHIESQVLELINQKRYRWVFHGHTHERRDEIIRGVRVVNPGALGGIGRETRSFCIVDLDDEQVEFIKI